MAATNIDLLLFSLLVPSLVLYIIFLYTLFKYRNKDPFTSPFFKLVFAFGIFDIMRLTEDWIMFKFSCIGWFGMDKLVLKMPYFFGKFHTIFAVYFGHANVCATLLLTFNRLSACAFVKTWTKKELLIALTIQWVVPVVMNAPLWSMEFYFAENNGTTGILLHWNNYVKQWFYLVFCGCFCSATAIVCFACYIVIAIRVWKSKRDSNVYTQNGQERKELKLVIVGVVLTMLGTCCAAACMALAFVASSDMFVLVLPYYNLVNDMWSWSPPYLLLGCSEAVRVHMKALLCEECCEPTVNI